MQSSRKVFLSGRTRDKNGIVESAAKNLTVGTPTQELIGLKLLAKLGANSSTAVETDRFDHLALVRCRRLLS